jgi:hypothetical protein
MIVFFKKLIDMFKNLLSAKSQITEEYIELDITWGDISSGMGNSKYGSVLAYAMRRNGIFGYATEDKIVLETGEEYSPVELSDHWNAYINSPKFKATTITYFIE